MCAVSAVTDYYRDKWPVMPLQLPIPGVYHVNPQQVVLKPGVMVTVEQWAEYQELKRRMEAYDAQTGQPDCIKPEVAEWEKIVGANVVQSKSEV